MMIKISWFHGSFGAKKVTLHCGKVLKNAIKQKNISLNQLFSYLLL